MNEGAPLHLARDAAEEGPNRERSGSPGFVKKFPREPHDHYVEERWVSARLFATRDFGPVIVDPCAGFGNVVLSARAAGLAAFGSDLVKRSPLAAGGRDFLEPRWRAPRRAGAAFAIVSNTPFRNFRAFAEAACARAARVALLVHVEHMNAALGWLEALPLSEQLYVNPRPSMWAGPIYRRKLAAGEPLGDGRRNACWLLFDRAARGRARIGLIRREA